MNRAFVRAIGSLLLVVAASAGAAPVAKQFFKQAPVAKSLADKPSGVQSRPEPVVFNAGEMLKMQPGEELQLALPRGKSHAAVFEKATAHGNGVTSWVGYLRERGKHNRVILTTGPGGSFGVIETPEGVFRVVPGKDHDWLIDMEQEQAFLPAAAPEVNDARVVEGPALPPAAYAAPRGAKASPTPQAEVDIMMVVTRGLADRLGTTLATRLNFLVTRANLAYDASEIAITLRLVNYTVIDYPDDTDNDLALDSISPSCTAGPPCNRAFNPAIFGSIEGIRAQYGADLVSFLRNGSSFGGSGIAWVPKPASASIMYSTLNGCVLGCESVFIHEVGHNMGNMHDRYTTSFQHGANAQQSQGLQPYSYGYAFCTTAYPCNPAVANSCTVMPECVGGYNATNFTDLMAYFSSSANLVYKFSNPSVNCLSTAAGNDGIQRPCGVSSALATSADTAQSMNGNRFALAGMKPTVAAANMPGSLQFTASSYSASETGGSVTFTVSRTSGSGGAVSVSYSVAGGTAIAGIDFAAASGTLNWAAGDAANKTFTVPITNDMAAEGVETFTATLSNPSGAPGVYIGYPSSAIAIIVEDWPIGGVAPVGFASPDGSAGAWSVVNDPTQAFEGSFSLRSAQVFGSYTNSPFTQNFTNSDLSFTGVLQAGQLTFAYRVSSYQSFGYLEFILDGTTVLSATGESGWQVFSQSVTAGPHTLRWRFKNALPSACNGSWNPAAVGGAACADRAWIDAVSLPLALTASSVALGSSANPSGVGQSITFNAVASGGAGTPTGTVAFRDGAAIIAGCEAIPLAAGAAACTTSALPAGTRSITASYSGSPAYAPSTSTALLQTVLAQVTLTIAKNGPGTGTVTSSPVGISCGATCAASVNAGAVTTLTATASGGSVFTGWNGACVGVGPCAVTPLAATTVTASFAVLAPLPMPAFNPASLDFGGQSIQTTAPSQTITVVNVGAGTLVVSNVATSDAQYAQTNTCTTLASGAACTVTVTFTPTAPAGAKAANLIVTASGGPLNVPLAGIAELSLVTHYYRAILNRAPDGAGKGYWEGEAARLSSLAVDVNETWYVMAGYFFNSAEYLAAGKNDAAFVADLYNTFFNRAPDGAGSAYWVGQIQGGLPREVVLFSFMFSTEFRTFTQGIFGNTASRPEVNVVMDFFRGILNRIPDTGSFQYWLGRMRTAQCAGAGPVYTEVDAISAAFIFNPEYSNRARNNTQFVTDMYYSFLRRGGDSGGVNYWINELNTSAKDVNTVRINFLNSPEFGARVQAVIAAGCYTGP